VKLAQRIVMTHRRGVSTIPMTLRLLTVLPAGIHQHRQGCRPSEGAEIAISC
jgi:hypothetical protein